MLIKKVILSYLTVFVFRFKLRKAKSARNKILAKALNGKKRTLRKAGKL